MTDVTNRPTERERQVGEVAELKRELAWAHNNETRYQEELARLRRVNKLLVEACQRVATAPFEPDKWRQEIEAAIEESCREP